MRAGVVGIEPQLLDELADVEVQEDRQVLDPVDDTPELACRSSAWQRVFTRRFVSSSAARLVSREGFMCPASRSSKPNCESESRPRSDRCVPRIFSDGRSPRRCRGAGGSGVAAGGRRQRHRMDRSGSGPPKDSSDLGHRPSGADEIVDEQHGPGRHRAVDREGARDVRLLVGAVLLVPLLGPLVDLDDAGLVRQLQPAPRAARPGRRRVAGRRSDGTAVIHSGAGSGRQTRIISASASTSRSSNWFVVLPSLPHERAPSGVAPLGEGPPFLDAIADRHALALRRDDQRPVAEERFGGGQQVGRQVDRRRLAGAVVADAARLAAGSSSRSVRNCIRQRVVSRYSRIDCLLDAPRRRDRLDPFGRVRPRLQRPLVRLPP